jgi:TusA-related sulfurtransferase
MDAGPSPARAFLDALTRRDFDALEATLDPAVRFRALVPGEAVAAATAADTAACFRRWFGDKTDIEILDQQIDLLVDRLRVGFRARVKKNGQPHLIVQQLCGDLDHGKFVSLDLLCTGFRPEAASPAHGTTHVFDAGDLGCGSGLPREFRTRLSQIPVGHVLEVVTGDPSAREDLPSMARLLGHQVRSVETGADGKVRIRVERSP